ncbi:hypothetical protein Egran_06723 [Elaphomyces granulatus]|uniref:Uncharacterized protein n=1 Tax=Elaphomyces granulatus TaxID=519963 RepID=A0A232LMY1_9EURO|nr:hypothetical protein Egran_06723 [Elaphomyces granulatus]
MLSTGIMPGQQSFCYEFANTGRCRFISSCKYTHVSSGSKHLDHDRPQTGPTQRRPRDEHLAIAETELRSWKVNLPQDSGPLRPLGHRLEFFFQEAQRLIETNASILQEVIPCLAGESGLRRIQELIEQEFHRMPLATKTHTFTSQILPFLRTMSHPTVLSSLVLEHAVGTIYNVLFGHGGRRTIRLFGYILDVLAAVDPADKLIVIYLEHSLTVFSQILDINSEAFIQEPLKGAAKRFAEIFIAVLDSQDVNLLNEARKYLERIERRLEIGSSLPTARPATVSTSTKNNPNSTFTIHSDPPGGRHDNDFKDISEIKILPTFQEILCPRAEYLPVKDPAQWHLAGVDGLLDRNFRLLREDTIGQLRDAIQPELEQLLHPKATHRRNERPNQMRTYVYSKAKVVDLCFDRLAGFQFGVEFPQPFRAVSSAIKRQEWWQISKRMLADALVCVVDSHGIVVFCTVLGFETAEQARARQEQSSQYKRKDAGLWKDENIASVYLGFVESNSENVRCILQHYQTQPASSLSLVEFPGVLLPAFQPTLRALQQMKTAGNLPFSEFLAPTGPQTSSSTVVPPPEYALKPGFGFNLRCLMNSNADLTLRPGQPFDIAKLQNNSTLDDAQAIALVNTLQRRIGLIQGPPGTGKSFTGIALVKVLLANKKRANIGPLICVCYTNHALDQLLEGLLDDQITSQIVRIGSRSRSERLAPFNLRRIGRDATKTKFEKRRNYDIHRKFDNHEQQFATLTRRLNARDAWSNVEDYLMENHSELHLHLFGVDEDGFQKVGGKNPESIFKNWLQWARPQVGDARSLEQLRTVNLDDMTIRERRILYQDWLKETKINLRAKVTQLISSHRSAKSDFSNIRDEIDLRCLSEADVIGVTTTGLARNLHMLRRLSSKVVLCEEAGEVLEAHLLTALLPSVEHAILIGDHLQLRPKIQNFELSRENRNGGEIYSLDVSLFERLVNPESQTGPKLLYSTLRTQRRMHPSIAQLIRETLYPRLHDAPAVFKYPQVTGIRKRLFWIDHTKPEVNPLTNDDMSTSHYNEHEIDMAAAIIKHLISQGTYKSGDIALLTPYLGQLQRLRRRLSQSYAIVLGDRDQDELEKEGFDVEDAQASNPILKSTLLENLRVATIDNFQGEEAKIVVVTLVRSNEQNRCGFLRTSNRINVLLSRAKHGMYIIGNSRTSSHVQMWGEIVNILQMSGNFGTSLELQCPRHPNNPIAFCGSKEIKDRVVDFILGEMYRDINLDENPCIFPRCGHFSTMESMDALMDIKKYYVVDHKDKPIAIAAPLDPFSMNDMKTCATCRGSLRDIARYGRLVRRALLDESTKKLILYINGEYVPLAREVSKQIQLLNVKRNNHKKTAVTAFESTNVLRVEGTRDRQAKLISVILNKHDKSRWLEAVKLRSSVHDYCRKVAIEEQPFNRVRNLVNNARRHKRGKGVFHFDESVLQTKGSLLAMALSMQLDIVLLADFLSLREQANNASKGELKLDLEVNRTECYSLIDAAAQSRHFRQQVEGYIFLAQLYALESPHTAAPNASARYREKGHKAISDARRICATHSSQTRGLVPEIDATEKMLRGTTFYSTVGTEERMVVITAMSKEFTGTGHWYYCQNGHPFTIGECGMPMQLARCPECQAPVGGRNHEITSGVRHANDIEGRLENMRIE